jgi:hypothetical protein
MSKQYCTFCDTEAVWASENQPPIGKSRLYLCSTCHDAFLSGQIQPDVDLIDIEDMEYANAVERDKKCQ